MSVTLVCVVLVNLVINSVSAADLDRLRRGGRVKHVRGSATSDSHDTVRLIDEYLQKEKSSEQARSVQQVGTPNVPQSSLVTGVAYLDGRIYAVSQQSNSILEYDGRTFDQIGTITVDGLRIATDLTADPDRKLLYVTDLSMRIWKVDPSGSTPAEVFETGGFTPASISFCRKSSQLVLVMQGLRQLAVYDTDYRGDVVSAEPTFVKLPGGLTAELKHAVCTSTGTYLVALIGLSNDKQHDQVTEITADGATIVNSFGGWRSSGRHHLSKPLYLAVDDDDSVLVADSLNGRVVRLSASLNYVETVVEGVQVTHLAVAKTRRQLIVMQKMSIAVYQM
jgi:hypothetical protein